MEFQNLLETVQDESVFDTGLLLSGDVNPCEIRHKLSRGGSLARSTSFDAVSIAWRLRTKS
jgi:hypothetical protein